jgi:hypothetical protein
MLVHIPLEPLILIGGVLGLTTFGLGALLGARRSALRRQVEELSASLELAQKERELTLAELAAAKERIAEMAREKEAYHAQVSEHFVGASDRLRDLTHQYRALYEHLATGASALCPENFAALEGGFDEAVAALETGEGTKDPQVEG